MSEPGSKIVDRIAETLVAYGCRFAVGIPGNDVLETIRACTARGIRFVLAKSEPSAAFIADAIWQIEERPVALIPALGPGLANAISGIAGALMERSAVIVLTGEVATAQSGLYTHQVFDHVALARPLTKYAATLNAERAAQQIAKALDIALAYPPGPVMLNIPADIGRAETKPAPIFRPQRRPRTILRPDRQAELHGMLEGARHPLALIGRGALTAETVPALRGFIDAWAMPFFTTYKAKGIVSEHHELALGAVGLSPVIDAENFKRIAEADLLVLIGFDPIELRDAWLDAWTDQHPILSFDWGPLDHRMFPTGLESFGDLPSLLRQVTRVEPGPRPWAIEAVRAHRDIVSGIVRPRDPAGAISPAALFHAVSRRVTENWQLTVDVGAHRILASHAIDCVAPGQLMQSNGLCCMGYAMAAAIGAQLARPESQVVALVGDGSMLMALGDLAQIAELDLPIIVIVLNDAALSLIKLKQKKLQLAPQAVDFTSPNFSGIAQAMGGVGIRAASLADFEAAFDAALGERRFTLIEAMIDPEEYLEQM
jgi:acetolactate synthase I/II/III large subunit